MAKAKHSKEIRQVVIRWHPSSFYVAYAKSYQPAWRSEFNSYRTREDAKKAIERFNAASHDCILRLVEHPCDQNREAVTVEQFFAWNKPLMMEAA